MLSCTAMKTPPPPLTRSLRNAGVALYDGGRNSVSGISLLSLDSTAKKMSDSSDVSRFSIDSLFPVTPSQLAGIIVSSFLFLGV